MRIGTVDIPSQLVLAPMAGVTDLAFRLICRELGAGLTVTEMVSAKALCYQDKKSRGLLKLSDGEHPASAQIFGSDPGCMAEAACIAAELSGADLIDINMGCPVGKIVSNGDGSALMRAPEKAARIAEAVVKASPVPVTVKMRRGWDKGSVNAVELARMLEQAGVSAVAVHGRTRPDVRRTGGLGHHPPGEGGGVYPGHRQRRRVYPGGCGAYPALYRGRRRDDRPGLSGKSVAVSAGPGGAGRGAYPAAAAPEPAV